MVSEQMKHLLGQAQIYQQQLQSLIGQKENLKMQLMETEQALDELEKTKQQTIYKITGPLLVKTKTAEAKKELQEKQKFIKFKIKTLEESEKKVQKRLDDVRARLTKSPDGQKEISVG